jgi:AsmA protein
MKRAVLYSLAGVAGLVALVAAAPLLVPTSVYKSQIESGITHATGRKFSVAGPLHFTLFPAPAIRADHIALAGRPGGHARSVVTAEDIRLNIRLWPLLSGRLELTRIVLDRPAISLEVTPDGRANWIFEHASKAKAGNSGSRFSTTPHYSAIEIVDGSVTYINTRTGTAYRFEGIDAGLRLTELDQPATATGFLNWAGRRVSFHATAATPKQFLDTHEGKLDLSLISGSFQASFFGAVAPDGRISGRIKADTTSLRDDATWLGAHMPNSGGFEALSLQSTVEAGNRSIALTKLAATLDGGHIKGDLRFALDAPLPLVEGALSVDHLDLNPYIVRRHRPGTASHAPRPEEWSNEPISLDILKKANASLTLDTGSVTVRNLQLGKTRLRVGLRDGKLDAALFPISLYSGKGQATLSIDTNRPTPVFHDDLEFDNIALQPFLADTIGVKQIEGTGTVKLDLTSTGESPRAVMRSMNGKGSIAFHDGRLHGVDLGAVARTIRAALGNTITQDSFTSFASMSGTFAVANGVLSNQDLELTGPVLKTTGSGTVDIGNRSIDFKIVPRATAVIAKQNLSLGVPFRIRGPWKHVHYTADVSGILNGVLNNLESGKAPFKGLFSPSKPKDPNAPKKKHNSIGDAVKNMLGIH